MTFRSQLVNMYVSTFSLVAGFLNCSWTVSSRFFVPCSVLRLGYPVHCSLLQKKKKKYSLVLSGCVLMRVVHFFLLSAQAFFKLVSVLPINWLSSFCQAVEIDNHIGMANPYTQLELLSLFSPSDFPCRIFKCCADGSVVLIDIFCDYKGNARLVHTDRNATVTQRTTLYNCGVLFSNAQHLKP